MRGCQFAAAGPAVVLGPGVRAAVVAENTQPGGVQVQNGIGARAQIGLNELPFALPAAPGRALPGQDRRAAAMRTTSGRAGSARKAAADVPPALKPAVTTARWAGAKAGLRLPVLPGRAYTLTLWASAPAGAPPRTFAVDGGPKAVVTRPGPQVVTLAIPARLTAGKHAIDCHDQRPALDPRPLAAALHRQPRPDRPRLRRWK